LTDEERVAIGKRLKTARERQHALNGYVAEMEQQLLDGTEWCLDPEDDKNMWKEVEEKVQRWREKDEEREIALYGRLLTPAERSYLVERPKEVRNVY